MFNADNRRLIRGVRAVVAIFAPTRTAPQGERQQDTGDTRSGHKPSGFQTEGLLTIDIFHHYCIAEQ
jgi:hypothetical protein